jgi:Zn-dependent peptidase ImmA (M78 family)
VVERKLRLSDRRIKEIRVLANDCLKRAGCDTTPIAIEKVAKELGADVLYAPYEGDDLAGMLINGGPKPIVAVNSAHHKNRQRFTIAHECGHLALGHTSSSHIDRTNTPRR